MKSVLLKISILLNLGLLGGLICLLVTGQKPVPAAPPQVAIATLVKTAAATGATSPPAKPEPFRWSQLYANDYHLFVKNLRATGCPEPTLRAIVTADVQAVCGVRRRALTKQLSDLAGSSWSTQLAAARREPDLRAELNQLPAAENGMVADYLGLATAPASLAADESPEDSANRPALPLVLHEVDLTPLNLNSNQMEIVDDLRQKFISKIKETSQNPDDPVYFERWQQAQSEVDNQLRGMIGFEAFQKYQMATREGQPPAATGQ